MDRAWWLILGVIGGVMGVGWGCGWGWEWGGILIRLRGNPRLLCGFISRNVSVKIWTVFSVYLPFRKMVGLVWVGDLILTNLPRRGDGLIINAVLYSYEAE